jgi:hypothetical protein
MKQFSKKTWRTAVVLLAALLSAAFLGPPALRALLEYRDRQEAKFHTERDEIYKKGGLLSQQETDALCQPDHVLEFVVGANSFYMPWKWVRGQTSLVKKLWISTGGACPTDPIHQAGFFLYPFIDEVARERDLNLFLLEFHLMSEWEKSHSYQVPTNPSARATSSNGGYIEDVTEQGLSAQPPYVKRGNPRVYRLQQPPDAFGIEGFPVEIKCADIDPNQRNRPCYGLFEYRGLRGKYEFWPAGGVTPNASNRQESLPGPTEPDGFLAFDARIRNWIDDLQRKPSP